MFQWVWPSTPLRDEYRGLSPSPAPLPTASPSEQPMKWVWPLKPSPSPWILRTLFPLHCKSTRRQGCYPTLPLPSGIASATRWIANQILREDGRGLQSDLFLLLLLFDNDRTNNRGTTRYIASGAVAPRMNANIWVDNNNYLQILSVRSDALVSLFFFFFPSFLSFQTCIYLSICLPPL